MTQKIEIREIPLLSHQLELVNDRETFELCLLGGYGAGKSKAKAFKHIDLCFNNQGFRSIYGAPTYPEIMDTAVPDMEWALNEMKIPYEFKQSPHPRFYLYFTRGVRTPVFCHSMENWRKWRSLNLSHGTLDEIDTMKPETALDCWNMLLSRLREGNLFQAVATTTPEEFGFCYERWVQEARPGRRIIHAKTTDNFFLPDSYVENLMKNYTSAQINAYINGEFCNTKSGRVYFSFDRKLNNSDLGFADAKVEGASLHIGVDFNVGGPKKGGMSAITHAILDENRPVAVDEILGSLDTPALISAIKERYHWANEITIYPDSSGKNRSSKGASLTDITLLQDAGFYCDYPKQNPRIKDRVNSMNSQFHNAKGERRYTVSVKDCPGYVEALEKQGYSKDGLPDKGKFDGPLDAGGYFISRLFGVDTQSRTAWL